MLDNKWMYTCCFCSLCSIAHWFAHQLLKLKIKCKYEKQNESNVWNDSCKYLQCKSFWVGMSYRCYIWWLLNVTNDNDTDNVYHRLFVLLPIRTMTNSAETSINSTEVWTLMYVYMNVCSKCSSHISTMMS